MVKKEWEDQHYFYELQETYNNLNCGKSYKIVKKWKKGITSNAFERMLNNSK